MRIGPLPTPLLLLLLSSASTTLTERLSNPDDPSTINDRAVGIAPPATDNSAANPVEPPDPRDYNGAPIDGKDGKPHAGPFVETSADRDRKKAKDPQDKENLLEPADALSESSGPNGKTVPYSNGGVMDDPYRPGPKEGTRGTEGGVSEKSKNGLLGTEKRPDAPKEAPPLPHSEQQKIPSGGGVSEHERAETDGYGDRVLQKPDHLPDAPYGYSAPASTADNIDDHLPVGDLTKTPSTEQLIGTYTDSKANEIIQPFHSFVLSLSMIVFSEIGDKTFLVAALMAMRHPRMVVFSSAFTALIAMTVLSAILGHAVPTLIPTSYTNLLAGILFLVFGVKMLLEAKAMAPNETVSEEMKEVEMELEEKEHQQQRVGRRRSSINPYALESGLGSGTRKGRSSSHRLPSPESDSSSSSRESSPSRASTVSSAVAGISNLCSLLLSPAWVQTFVMTFLGEWGDRSQIATIAMAAGQDYWWVTCGAIIGHGFCTAAAVLGGRAVAGKVSMRVVTFGGSIAFFIFAVLYLFEAIY